MKPQKSKDQNRIPKHKRREKDRASRRKIRNDKRARKRSGNGELPHDVKILQIDLHGMTREDCAGHVRSILTESASTSYYIRFVHGYNTGQVLRDVVRAVATEAKLEWFTEPNNQGTTIVKIG